MQGKESRPFTIEDYNKVVSLKKQGFSQNQIQKKTGISSATVWHWTNTSRKPRCLYAFQQQRKINSSAKKLSKELAYLLGVLIGDGWIETNKKNNRIGLFVKDKDFALYFYDIIKKWSGLEPLISKRKIRQEHKTKYGNWIRSNSVMYTIRLNSVQAINFLQDKIVCSTYDWKVPTLILNCKNKKIICSFLKGFFDSEGSAILCKRWRRIEATILNTNNGLKDIQDLLARVGIKSTINPTKHGAYVIRIWDRKSISLFAKNINFTINRKKEILSKILKSYKREPYEGQKTKEEILISLRKEPKTIRELSWDTNKHYNTIRHHLNRFNGDKVKIVRKELKEGVHLSNIWDII